MDVLAALPFSASSIEWQNLPAQWMVTVVCKATYSLRPGTSPIAPERDPISDHDNFWDDDPERSLFVASDLAPAKPRPEVTLVGSAFAPRGEPVRTLVVRLRVGSVDKTIEVFVPRTVMGDGTIREGAAWKQMPLLYERAAGGFHTWNPLGMSSDTTDRNGRRSLPNLQRPGLGTNPKDPVEPIGFGPIAATWSVRRDRLGLRATSWSEDTWTDKPLGVGFDKGFFQTAPADQLLDELQFDQSLTLENLHPDHPLLTTRLARIRPRAKLESADGSSSDIDLVPDTLAIDTNRGTCTLAWRGHVEVDRPRVEGRVLVGAEEAGGAMRWPAVPRPPSSRDGFGKSPPSTAAKVATGTAGPPVRSRPPPPPRAALRSADADAINMTVDEDEARAALPPAALPFRSSGSIPPARPSARPPPPAPRSSLGSWHEDDHTQAAPLGAPPLMPAWVAQGPAVLPPAPLASLGSMRDDGDSPPPSRVFQQGASLTGASVPDRVNIGNANERALVSAAYGGVLQASNAARDHEASLRTNGKKESAPRVDASVRGLLELVWFDQDALPAVRAKGEWAPFMSSAEIAELPPLGEDGQAPAAESDRAALRARAAADRASVIAVLARAEVVHDVEAALQHAIGDDGSFTPPLSVIAGELETTLDDVEMLKILMAAAGPLAPTDKKLKEVLDLAQEVMKTPLGTSREVAAGWVGRVREAWSKANRLLPADYLDHHARRLLLDQRLYQKRQLADASFIRALLTPPGASTPIPVYLPEAVGRKLPLFTRFSARVLGELVPQQDESEASSVAVRASALVRTVAPKQRR